MKVIGKQAVALMLPQSFAVYLAAVGATMLYGSAGRAALAGNSQRNPTFEIHFERVA